MGVFVLAALLGLIPAFIAQSKGRSFGGWWVYGFLLFIVAIIHVLIIPSTHNISVKSSELRDCPFCAEPIRRQALKCKHCGSEIFPLTSLNEVHIPWKRLSVLALSLSITYLIVKFLGLE